MQTYSAHRQSRTAFVVTSIVMALYPGAIWAQDSWTSFQNGGNTSVNCRQLPLTWSPESVTWTAALPGYGQSAPVVWQGRVYVTAIQGDNKEWCHVLAFEHQNGKLLWKRKFKSAVQQRNSYMVSRAAPTPVVDREGVYVLFGSGDLRAFTHEGNARWQVSFFDNSNNAFQNGHGYGSSPAQTRDAIVVLVDHRGPSYLTAISKKNGEPLWKTARKSRSSWTSPQVVRAGKHTQIVVSSTGSVDGYDAKTGRQLWTYEGLTGNTIPSVTIEGDLVFVGAAISQRQPDVKGATASNCCLKIMTHSKSKYKVLWKAKKSLCHYVSPLVHRGKVYYVNRVGALFCLDSKTGKVLKVNRLSGPCWAHPIACGSHIYFFHKNGSTTLLKEGPKLEIVAVNRLWNKNALPLPNLKYNYQPEGPDDPRPAKPGPHYQDPILYGVAAVDGRFFIRIGTHLYCICSQSRDGQFLPSPRIK